MVSADMLLDSFKRYVSESERALIDQCLNDEIDINDKKLLDFFTDFDCKVILKQGRIQGVSRVSHDTVRFF